MPKTRSFQSRLAALSLRYAPFGSFNTEYAVKSSARFLPKLLLHYVPQQPRILGYVGEIAFIDQSAKTSMNWKEKRQKMDVALKNILVSELRRRGFVGSYPHFRRVKIKKINLFSFQFSQWGGQFYINIANSPIDGVPLASGHHIKADKIKPDQCPKWKRLNNFFDFGKDNYEEVAEEVLAYLDKAEEWWNNN